MGKAKFSLNEQMLNLDQIEGRYNAFAKAYYALPIRMSKPLAEDGYGTAMVDGIEISKGPSFTMNVMVTMYMLLLPVGEVAREYGKEYTLTLTGFTAADGSAFQDATLKFKTKPRANDHNPAYAAHEETALNAAREGMVLLKNSGILPLNPKAVLNVFGAGQYMFRNTATGAGLINPRWQANFHQSLREHSSFQINEPISSLFSHLKDVTPSDAQLEAAKKVSDIGVIVISRTSGEFLDNKPAKGGFYLTDDESEMVKAAAAHFSKTIAIINSGYPMDIRWAEELNIGAVIYTGFSGMGAGYALMEILDGRTNPSGKLPDTWVLDYYDHPSAANFPNFKAEDKLPGEKDYGVELYYEEDIYVGYRYFDTFQKPVLYPFGHGLSYTRFEKSGTACFDGTGIHASVTVKNAGAIPGKEVSCIYVKSPAGKLEKPFKVLCGFEKSRCLNPGETETLTISAPAINFASFSEEQSAYILEAGTYTILCDNMEIGCFTLSAEEILRKTAQINAPVEHFHRLCRGTPAVQADSHNVPLEDRVVHKAPRPVYAPDELPAYKGRRITWSDLKARRELIDAFVAQMTDKELCKLNVGGGANWYMPWQDGSACKNNRISRLKMPLMKVSDGNTGLNLKKPNIGFPSSATIAATFNKRLAYEIGKTIGEESRENGIAVNLGPAANLHRNILNGRHPEYFSEDPILAGTMAAFHAKGLEDAHTGATYKHLFCNGSDTCRKASHSIVSERALRELYFKVFDVAMSIYKPSCVMTSYNAVNGIYPAENPDILQKLLKDEWGFDGFIMTDWGTCDTVDPVEMAKAGNCWITEGNAKLVKALEAGVKENRLSRAALEHNAKKLIALMLKYC